MAKEQDTTKYQIKQRRVFSITVKKQVVKDIESGKCTITQAKNELAVSYQSIYKWIRLFSRHLSKNRVMVVEDSSEAYRSKELEKRIKELEAALGRKQLELDYLNKLIEIAGKELNIDLKKNTKKSPLDGFEPPKDRSTETE